MESCTVNIHLKPKAKFNRCELGSQNVLEIAVTSPPVDNKANEHLQKYLAELLKISKSSVTIIKVIRVKIRQWQSTVCRKKQYLTA
jgi:uncharacterized protein YggU (UPF0235/DUF167 family)